MGNEVGQGTFDRPGLFTMAECAALVGLAEGGGFTPAPVYGAGAGRVDRQARSAATLLLERGDAPPWLFDRLDALFADGAAWFGTPVDAIFEPVQIVRYGVGDHFQLWHSDAGTDRHEQRRLSASIELSDPEAYAGGLLEIAPGRMLPQVAPMQGHATVFPSRMLHHVTPVTRGVRYALVAWTGLNAA